MKPFQMMITWDFQLKIEAENKDQAMEKFQNMTWDEAFNAAKKAGIFETVESFSENEEE